MIGRRIAAACVVMLPAVAGAQSMTIYGRLYPELVHARTHDATAGGAHVATLQSPPTGETGSVTAVEASNSRLGLRGEELLPGGLKVVWQIEQAIDVDRGGSTLASRDTFVGVDSDAWGTLRLGFMDTIYKDYGDTLGFLGIGSGNFVSISNVLSKSNLSDTSAASFHLRRGNSVKYESPAWAGVSFGVQYSPDELMTASLNAYLVAIGAKYEDGPLYLAAAYERHNDFFGGSRASRSAVRNLNDPNARSRDDAIRLTAQVRLGVHSVEVNYARLRYRERNGQPGRFERFESDRWSLAWDARWRGPWRTAVAYAGASDGSCSLFGSVPCGTQGLDGAMIAAGAGYNLSRRTTLFAIASRLRNGRSALFNNAESLAPAVGADITQVAVGMSHQF